MGNSQCTCKTWGELSDSVSKMTVLCEVCRIQEKKYKCPTCKIFYCSLGCFKTHKESQIRRCSPPDTQGQSLSNEDGSNFPDGEEEGFLFQTPDTVPLETLQLLAQSEKLKNLLENPHLREFLTILDSSEGKGRLMRRAMKEPLFVEFVDCCLEVIDPESAQKELTDVEVLQAVKESVEAADDEYAS